MHSDAAQCDDELLLSSFHVFITIDQNTSVLVTWGVTAHSISKITGVICYLCPFHSKKD